MMQNMKVWLMAVVACCGSRMVSAAGWRMVVEKEGVTNVVTAAACPFAIDISFGEKDGALSGRIVNHDPAAYVLGFEVWDDPIKVVAGKSRMYLPIANGMRISNWPDYSWTNRNTKIWTALEGGRFELVRGKYMYPSRRASMQWATVNDGVRGRLMMSEDPMAGAKEIAGVYDVTTKTMRLGWRLPMFLAQGDAYEIPRLVFRDYEGAWHAAAKTYRAWWNTCRTFVKIPEKLKDSVGFMMVIVKQQNDVVTLPYTEFGSFADTVRAWGLRHVEFHGWGIGGHDKFYPEYDPDPKMGGREGLMAGIRAMQDKGLHVSIYSNGQLQHQADTKWYREVGERCPVRNRDGSSVTESWVKFKDYPGSTFDVCCPSNPLWRDQMLKICRQAKMFGADGFFYDQIGNQMPRLCFDTRHGHRRGANVYTHDRETMLAGIIAAMQKEDPEFMIWSEQFNDTILGSVAHNQSLAYTTDKGFNVLSRFNPAAEMEYYPEMAFCAFPELRASDRRSTAACSRHRANETAVCNLRVDLEVRYVPDRKYVEEGIEPAPGAYDNMASRPSEIEVMKAANWKSDRDYLRAVSDFRRANRDLLLRGTFRADEGFAVSGGEKIVANRWDGSEGMLGILVWNADPVPRKVAVRLTTGGVLVATSEPERGVVDPGDAIPANSLRLYRYRMTGMKPQDPSRVREIAKMLRPEAGFAETRIGNRAFWEESVDDEVRQRWIGKGEALLEDPLPTMEGVSFFPKKGESPSTWIKRVQEHFKVLQALVLAECAENGGRFLPRIQELLDAISAIRTWSGYFHDQKGLSYRGVSRMLDLGSGMHSQQMAIVLDVLRERLDSACRARAIKALRTMTLDVYLEMARDMSTMKRHSCRWIIKENNWNAACNNYFLTAALRTLDDPMERAVAIELAERSTRFYLNSFTEDGLSLEGASYWNYGFGNYLELLMAVKAATGDFLGFKPEPFLSKCFLSSFGTEYCPGSSPRFGDCNAQPQDAVQNLGRYVWPDCEYCGQKGLFSNGFCRALAIGALVPAGTSPWRASRPYDYPLRSWYPAKVGQLICRPAVGLMASNRIYAAIQGNFSKRCSHEHHDLGSYSIAPGGVDVMGDLGNSLYKLDTFGPKRFDNPLRNSYGHPVPRVDGKLQSGGADACARILESSFSDAEDRVVYDLRTAYRAVTNLTVLTRTFRYLRPEGRVIVSDHVSFDGKGAFETALTTTGKVADLGNGFYRYVSPDGKATAVCHVRVTGGAWHFADEELPGEVGSQWNTPGKTFKARRQAVVLDGPVDNAEIEVEWAADVAKPGPAGSAVSAAWDLETVRRQAERMADWQIATPVTTGRFVHQHTPLYWTMGAFYNGLLDWGFADPQGGRFVDYVRRTGVAANWDRQRLDHCVIGHADTHCVCSAWLQLAAEDNVLGERILAAKACFDELMADKREYPLEFNRKDPLSRMRWTWADALYMSPPSWVLLAGLTGERAYLDRMASEFRATTEKLFNAERRLFYRDSTFLPGGANWKGRDVFWCRGNGWVFGALAMILRDLPAEHPARAWFDELFRKMADGVLAVQTADGSWHPDLTDEKSPDCPEMSGTSFFTYGLLWGLNNGLLDPKVVEPAVRRAWDAICRATDASGRLGWVQQVGSSPAAELKPEYFEVYATGACLCAAKELCSWIVRSRGKLVAAETVVNADPRYLADKEVRIGGDKIDPGDVVWDVRYGRSVGGVFGSDGAFAFKVNMLAGQRRTFWVLRPPGK